MQTLLFFFFFFYFLLCNHGYLHCRNGVESKGYATNFEFEVGRCNDVSMNLIRLNFKAYNIVKF